MTGVLLVARAWKLCRNPTDSIRGSDLRFEEFTSHSKLSIHLFYAIYAFAYRIVESDIVLSYIRYLIGGPSRAVGPGVVTVTWYPRDLCLNARWKVLDIAIDVVSEVIVYA
jgi:hypothetical protein